MSQKSYRARIVTPFVPSVPDRRPVIIVSYPHLLHEIDLVEKLVCDNVEFILKEIGRLPIINGNKEYSNDNNETD